MRFFLVSIFLILHPTLAISESNANLLTRIAHSRNGAVHDGSRKQGWRRAVDGCRKQRTPSTKKLVVAWRLYPQGERWPFRHREGERSDCGQAVAAPMGTNMTGFSIHPETITGQIALSRLTGLLPKLLCNGILHSQVTAIGLSSLSNTRSGSSRYNQSMHNAALQNTMMSTFNRTSQWVAT